MVSFRQLRKLPGLDSIVKDLAEKLQRAQADQGVEDVTLFRQNRVDYDGIAYTDASTHTLNGDKVDSDAIALTDSHENSKKTKGTFKIAEGKDRIKLWLRFENDLLDYSGNGNNASVIAGTAQYTDGKIRHGGYFNGSTGLVIADHATLDATDEMEISFYFRPDNLNATMVLLDRRTPANATCFEVYLGTNGALFFQLTCTGGGRITISSAAGLIVAGGAYLVNANYDGATMTLLVNGSVVASTAQSGNIDHQDCNILISGEWNSGALNSSFRYVGMIDDLRIYMPHLSSGERTNLKNTPLLGGSIHDPPLCIGYGDIAA